MSAAMLQAYQQKLQGISHGAIIAIRSSEPCGLYPHEIIANMFRAQRRNYDIIAWRNMSYYCGHEYR